MMARYFNGMKSVLHAHAVACAALLTFRYKRLDGAFTAFWIGSSKENHNEQAGVPPSKQDLLAQAKRKDAPKELLDTLERIPEEELGGPQDVMKDCCELEYAIGQNAMISEAGQMLHLLCASASSCARYRHAHACDPANTFGRSVL